MSINTLERPSLWSFASAASKIASYRSCQRRGGVSAMESTAVLCGVMGKHPKNLSRLIAGKHVSIMHHSASTAFAQGELCLAACAHGPRRISGGQSCPESELGRASCRERVCPYV